MSENAADALAAADLASLEAAQAEWVRPDNHQSLDHLVDQAMGAVAPLPG